MRAFHSKVGSLVPDRCLTLLKPPGLCLPSGASLVSPRGYLTSIPPPVVSADSLCDSLSSPMLSFLFDETVDLG